MNESFPPAGEPCPSARPRRRPSAEEMRHVLDFGNPSTEELLRWMLYANKSVQPAVRELRERLAAVLIQRLQTIPFVNLVDLDIKNARVTAGERKKAMSAIVPAVSALEAFTIKVEGGTRDMLATLLGDDAPNGAPIVFKGHADADWSALPVREWSLIREPEDRDPFLDPHRLAKIVGIAQRLAFIPSELREQDGRWAPFDLVPKKSRPGEFDKMPRLLSGLRDVGIGTNRAWFGFAEAARAFAKHGHSGVGLLLTQGLEGLPDHDLLALDFDKVLDDGNAPDWVRDLIEQGGTYAEVSPSGRGVRVIGRLPAGRAFADIGAGQGRVEAYAGGTARYVTVTGQRMPGAPATIETFSAEFLDMLDGPEFRYPKTVGAASSAPREGAAPFVPRTAATATQLAEIADALKHLSPDADSRAEWIRAGHNLKSLGEVGRELWDEWSRRSALFDAADQDKTWPGLHGDRSDFRAILERARAAGWVSPLQKTMDDAGSANILWARTRGRLRWVPGVGEAGGCFLCWTESVGWQWDENSVEAQREALGVAGHWSKLAREKAAEAEGLTGAARKQVERTAESFKSFARACRETKRIGSLFKFIRSDARYVVPAERLDTDPELLGAANGVIDLRTRALRNALRDEFVTLRANAAFDPSARCPEFERLLTEATGQWDPLTRTIIERPDLRAFLLRWLGYIATGHTREHKVLIALGGGANGKGAVFDAVSHVLGELVSIVATDALMAHKSGSGESPTPSTAGLRGKRLGLANEVKAGTRFDTGLLKRLAGDEKISARFLNGNPITFPLTAKVVLRANHMPGLDQLDDAVRDRLHIMPFDVRWNRPGVVDRDPTLPDGDPKLGERLKAEASGILALIVREAQAYLRDGLLAPPTEVTGTTREFLAGEDPVGRFIDQACERCDPSIGVTPKELLDALHAWALDEGEQIAVNPTSLASALRRHGVNQARASARRSWGLRLKGRGDIAAVIDIRRAPLGQQ